MNRRLDLDAKEALVVGATNASVLYRTSAGFSIAHRNQDSRKI